MKIITIHHVMYGDLHGDSESVWFFTAKEAENHAINIEAHLTERERKKRYITIEANSIRIPDEYHLSTPKQLSNDLFNGDIECPDFDECTATFTSEQEYFKTIL